MPDGMNGVFIQFKEKRPVSLSPSSHLSIRRMDVLRKLDAYLGGKVVGIHTIRRANQAEVDRNQEGNEGSHICRPVR